MGINVVDNGSSWIKYLEAQHGDMTLLERTIGFTATTLYMRKLRSIRMKEMIGKEGA